MHVSHVTVEKRGTSHLLLVFVRLSGIHALKALSHVTISSTISSTFHRRRWKIVDIVNDEPATRNDNVKDADVK